MRLVLGAALAAFVGTTVSAQNSWTTYDWQTGNSYSNHSDQMGVTTYGNNLQTGSNWQLRQNYDGSYSGTDANGDYFFGNQNTGAYTNLGTGVTCYGTGYARTCY